MEVQRREIETRSKCLHALTNEADKLKRLTGWKEGNAPVDIQSQQLKLAELR